MTHNNPHSAAASSSRPRAEEPVRTVPLSLAGSLIPKPFIPYREPEIEAELRAYSEGWR